MYGAYKEGGTRDCPVPYDPDDPPPAQLYSADPGNGQPGLPWISVDYLGNLYVYGVKVIGGSGVILPNSSPPSPVAGEVQLYGASGAPAYVAPSGLAMNVGGSQLATFPNLTVTQATLHNIATATYPGGDAVAGSVYELEVWGNGIQGTAGNRQTLEISISLGGNALTNVVFGSTALPDTQAIFRFRARCRIICNTAGVAGTWTSFIDACVSQFNQGVSAANFNTQDGFSCESSTMTAVDTTVNETFAVQAAWGATTGGPTLTSQVAMFRKVA